MSSTAGLSNSRWSAPELIDPALIGLLRASSSTCTDVWSFGMLCLELMTGTQPYSDISQDITAAISISKGKLPPRPGHPAISQGLTDGLWALMMKCWKGDPQDRPLMTAVKADIKKLRGDTGLSPNPCTATHCQCLLSSDTIYSPAPTILTSSPIQIHTELAPESPKSIPPKRKNSRPSTAGSSSSESKGGRSSFGLLSIAFGRHSRSSSHQHSPRESFQTIPPASSSISPISPILPEIRAIEVDDDEGGFGLLDSAQAYPASRPAYGSYSRSHAVRPHRGDSVMEPSPSTRSTLQIPGLPSSLPWDYESHIHPTSSFDDKPPSLLRDSSNASVCSGTLESVVSNDQPLVIHARDGTIEAATLGGLIEQLIIDFSCERIKF
jgi:son of sevenless-like protein